MVDQIEVTQADREAAADSAPHNHRWGSLVRLGHLDHDPLVQAFARHRLASVKATLEAANLLAQAILAIDPASVKE